MDLERYIHGHSVEGLNAKREEIQAEKVPRSKRYLSQLIAAGSINLILFDIGLALSYPTLVVAFFDSLNNDTSSEHQSNGYGYNSSYVRGNFSVLEDVHPPDRDASYELSFFRHYRLTQTDITWYVSVCYICEPLGSLLGGGAIGVMGRKRMMQLVNLFMLTAWLLPFFSTQPVYMYLSNIFFGIGIGCSESPVATYVGEITEVSFRGVSLTLSQAILTFSLLVPLLLSLVVTSWRWQALILSIVPIITFIICCIVPESPVWLISKSRHQEALESLKWLRGWATSDQVMTEHEEMCAYHLETKQQQEQRSQVVEKERGWLKDELRYFLSSRVRRPFLIVASLFALIYISGMGTIRPYLVPLFNRLNITLDSDECAIWVTLVGAIGNFITLCLVKYTGKRPIVLSALLGSAVCTLVIALIIMDILPSAWSFLMIMGVSFFSGFGIIPIPWILQCELYPFRARGFVGGFGAAFSYFIGFVSTKTYLGLVDLITLEGVFVMFTCFSIFGMVYLWILLPETEGKSYQEIDDYFNRLKNKKKTDSSDP